MRQSLHIVPYGSSITLACSVPSDLANSSISWQHVTTNGNWITVPTSNSDKYSGGTTAYPNLIILNADTTHEGEYRCLATNNAGTWPIALVNLDVVGSKSI